MRLSYLLRTAWLKHGSSSYLRYIPRFLNVVFAFISVKLVRQFCRAPFHPHL